MSGVRVSRVNPQLWERGRKEVKGEQILQHVLGCPALYVESC
jgi:hypothetical protein